MVIDTAVVKYTFGTSWTEPSPLLASSPDTYSIEVVPIFVRESLLFLPFLAIVQEFLQELLFLLVWIGVTGCLLLVVLELQSFKVSSIFTFGPKHSIGIESLFDPDAQYPNVTYQPLWTWNLFVLIGTLDELQMLMLRFRVFDLLH